MPKISALQISSHRGTAATLEHILTFEDEIKKSESDLVLLPEATLGGYPKGTHFGTRMGFRTESGRAEYEDYWQAAITVPGKETDVLAGLSRRTGATIVIGVIEKEGTTLYCTALFFTPETGYTAKHRKLMPTAMEKLVWGQGDGSTLPVVQTAAGKAGAVICWENYMPLLRTTMYAKGVQIYCAPTVDEREIWQSTIKHISTEGRCFTISCCPYMPSPSELNVKVEAWADDRPLMRGASIIANPYGEIIAGPLIGQEGLLTAEIDLADITKARYDLDVSGHYSRPDVFTLSVDESPKNNVTFK